VSDVNRKLVFLLGLVLGASLFELLRRRRGEAPAADPRADELRRKLAESRAETASDSEPDPGLVSRVEDRPAPAGPEDVEALRRRVYEEGRTAAEQMRRLAGES
jgi:hypothetical protein